LYYAYNPLDNTPYLYGSRTSVIENDTDWRKLQQDYILIIKEYRRAQPDASAGFTRIILAISIARQRTCKEPRHQIYPFQTIRDFGT